MTIKEVKELHEAANALISEINYESGFQLKADLELMGISVPDWDPDKTFQEQHPMLKWVLSQIQNDNNSQSE